MLKHDGAYYFFFNNWGDCPGVDCCDTQGGCWTCCMDQHHDCTFAYNHSIVGYKSVDLKTFEPLGPVFSPADFNATRSVVVFRPHVLFNELTKRFVLWYKVDCRDCPRDQKHWYGVATSSSVSGPFNVEVAVVATEERSDHFLYKEEGSNDAYLINQGRVTQLNESYTGVLSKAAKLPIPASWEAPVRSRRAPSAH